MYVYYHKKGLYRPEDSVNSKRKILRPTPRRCSLHNGQWSRHLFSPVKEKKVPDESKEDDLHWYNGTPTESGGNEGRVTGLG